jgi:hypothetical protein
MKKICTTGSMLAILLTLAASAAANSCIGCHSDADFYARFPRLYNYYQDWIESPHSQAGVTCDECHSGDPDGAEIASAHKGMFPVNNSRSSLYFSRQPATCGACHADKQAEFEQSKHFGALESEIGAAPTCTTCHPAMNRRPTYQTIVLNACTTCHQQGNRQGLPLIVDDAEELLRSINVSKGMLGWATLHFSSHKWPGDSRETMRDLEQRYARIVDQVHRFDLQESDRAIRELLAELRNMFEAERRSKGVGPQN